MQVDFTKMGLQGVGNFLSVPFVFWGYSKPASLPRPFHCVSFSDCMHDLLLSPLAQFLTDILTFQTFEYSKQNCSECP